MKLAPHACATLLCLAAQASFLPSAQAVQVTYDFSGRITTQVSPTTSTVHPYMGSFTYETSAAPYTVFTPGNVPPLQQGFSTIYAGAMVSLRIVLDNGNVVSSQGGNLQVYNIFQSEPGAQLGVGQGLLAGSGAMSGSIDGVPITDLYLSFYGIAADNNWDRLDTYFGGNAEQILTADPTLLPTDINPALTGTVLPTYVLTKFNADVFLGSNYAYSNAINTAENFVLRAVPEPATGSMMLLGLMAAVGSVKRRLPKTA
jgi:hypothetical protein